MFHQSMRNARKRCRFKFQINRGLFGPLGAQNPEMEFAAETDLRDY